MLAVNDGRPDGLMKIKPQVVRDSAAGVQHCRAADSDILLQLSLLTKVSVVQLLSVQCLLKAW
jgi:hypothetical protein